jgi:hypothetical protein
LSKHLVAFFYGSIVATLPGQEADKQQTNKVRGMFQQHHISGPDYFFPAKSRKVSLIAHN